MSAPGKDKGKGEAVVTDGDPTTPSEPPRARGLPFAHTLNAGAVTSTGLTDAGVTPPERVLTIGQQFGTRYEIRELLGAGGVGAVYRALDSELGEDVALKLVSRDATDLLRDEVRLAQKVTHPNVCRTYDLEVVDDVYVVKMEYIAGETLWQRLAREGRLSIDATLAIARAVSDGLAAAHAVGIVHRDLKPGNVMLAEDRVVLMDFGLALRGGVNTDRAGTPGYMSPEQLLGGPIDARSDLYALGCLIYEMLAGEPVYGQGTAYELAARHAAAVIPDVRVKRPETPRRIARAVTHLLAKQPDDRADGLARLADRTRRAYVAIPIVLAAFVAAAIAVWRLAPSHAWVAATRALSAYAENANAPSISPDGRTILYAAVRDGNTAANVYAVGFDEEEPRALLGPGIEPRWVHWAHDGKSFVYSTVAERVFRQHLIDGNLARLGPTDDLGPGSAPDACGDGVVLVVDHALVRLAGAVREVLFAPHDGLFAWAPRCDPSGRLVVFATGPVDVSFAGADINVIDLTRPVREIMPLVTDHHALFATFTPDGRTVVYSHRDPDGRIHLFDIGLADRSIHALTAGEANGIDVAAEVTPDGEHVVFNRDTTTRLLYTNRTVHGKLERSAVTSRIEMLSLATPLSTGAVLVVRRSYHENVILVVTPDGKERDLGPGSLPIASLDGQRALTAAGTDRNELVAIALATRERSVLARLPGEIVAGVEARDGIHLAIDAGHGWEAWRVAAGSAQPEGVAGLVVPSPDGAARAIVTKSGAGYQLEIAWYTKPDGRRTIESPRVTWLDANRLAYYAGGAFHVASADHADVVLATPAVESDRSDEMVLAPDGVHWYDTKQVGKVTRYIIENFGQRPWK